MPPGGEVLEVPFRDAIWGLFFFPHLVLPLLVMSGRWFRAWLLFTVFFLVLAPPLAFSVSQKIRRDVRSAIAEATAFAGPVQFDQGRLSFPGRQLPATHVSHGEDGWFLHLAPAGSTPGSGASWPDDCWLGFWISSDQAFLLTRGFQGWVPSQPLYDHGGGLIPDLGRSAQGIASGLPQGRPLAPAEMAACLAQWFDLVLPAALLLVFAVLFLLLNLANLLLALFTSVLPGPFLGSYRHSLCLFYYGGLPPLLVAALYSATFLGLGTLFQAYLWGVMIFLGLCLFLIMRRNQEEASGEGGDDRR